MRSKGYQLFELMLVCSLLVSLSTLFLPFLDGIADQERLHGAGQAFRSAVATARYQSVAQNRAIRICIHEDRKRFATAEGEQEPALWQELGRGVTFSSIPARLPTFYSRGTASPGGSFVLTNPAGQIRIVVSVSGRIRWERLN